MKKKVREVLKTENISILPLFPYAILFKNNNNNNNKNKQHF